MTFAPLGDSAVVVTLGAAIDEAVLLRVRSLAAALELDKSAGVVDVVPAYATVTVFYDIAWHGPTDVTPYERVCALIRSRLAKVEHTWPDLLKLSAERHATSGSVVEIPVCYEGEFAPDLRAVAQHTRLNEDEVVNLHAAGNYLVHAVGFAPGFAYLGGLEEKLFTPRRPSPRTAVPAGSVGIGWKQTGIYSLVTPGGWQLIGRTPTRLFQPQSASPALLRVGDRVKFKKITSQEFHQWK